MSDRFAELEGLLANNKDVRGSLNLIQASIVAGQRSIFANNGHLRQFIVDDKGFVVLAGFARRLLFSRSPTIL